MKKILVTGGSRGIGRKIALVLANNYEVHSFAKSETITEHLDHPNHDKLVYFKHDITDSSIELP